MSRNLYLKPHELPKIADELHRDLRSRLRSFGLDWSPNVSRSAKARIHRWLEDLLASSDTRAQFDHSIERLGKEMNRYAVALAELKTVSADAVLLSPKVFRKVVWNIERGARTNKGIDIPDGDLRNIIGSVFRQLDQDLSKVPSVKYSVSKNDTTNLLSGALYFLCCILGLDFEFLCARVECK